MKFSTILLLSATTAIAFASQSRSQLYARDCLVECGFHKLVTAGPATTPDLGALGEIPSSKSSLKKRGNLIKSPTPQKYDNNGDNKNDEGNNNDSGDRHQEQRQDNHRSPHYARHGHSLDAIIGLKVIIVAKAYINILVNALLDIKADVTAAVKADLSKLLLDLGAGTLANLRIHLNALNVEVKADVELAFRLDLGTLLGDVIIAALKLALGSIL